MVQVHTVGTIEVTLIVYFSDLKAICQRVNLYPFHSFFCDLCKALQGRSKRHARKAQSQLSKDMALQAARK